MQPPSCWYFDVHWWPISHDLVSRCQVHKFLSCCSWIQLWLTCSLSPVPCSPCPMLGSLKPQTPSHTHIHVTDRAYMLLVITNLGLEPSLLFLLVPWNLFFFHFTRQYEAPRSPSPMHSIPNTHSSLIHKVFITYLCLEPSFLFLLVPWNLFFHFTRQYEAPRSPSPMHSIPNTHSSLIHKVFITYLCLEPSFLFLLVPWNLFFSLY